MVVTGMGAITPFGVGVEKLWKGLVNGESAIRRITRFDPSRLDARIAGEVPDFDPLEHIDKREAKRMDRFTQFAVTAAGQALRDAGLTVSELDPDRVGVLIGSGIGGIETLLGQHLALLEKGPGRISPFFIPMMIANMAAGHVAIYYGAKGPNCTTVTACASSANAIRDAFDIIRQGEADVMVAGGSEAPLVELAFAGFCSMKALSTRNEEPERACRPFDRERDGFVMSEGAGVLVLESEDHALRRGARIYGEILGCGMTADAYHITAPDPEGEGGARSMARALHDAGIAPGQVDYINAHGTSTPANDRTETMGIKRVFGEHARTIPVSSTKSMIGHLLGAAGAVELIATILTIKEGIIPPTINYENPDPDCDLDYVPNRARPADVRVALSNSFGFGGQNVSIVVGRYDEGPHADN